ncbi:SWI/SNF and RSC complex subunit Ssr1 [Schizosaccharomyces japonicus yFS275]|uniref:SWI/SNF and RSC complex subunit Ssr1 n=1 Tax=Schizosaccharomyces japonicus (strain yFS275 / FY16936) TaxID=402676 RepID=B6K0N1_SCHJY|nr:SWI/SNF and RSC complex subunit Ssr1 [Schizosaccharomyces japonicus yFS275]EEB07502.1 SWI/SNF and RSC complex subunit Ssr1 [Schizosaccharomyces japonicus yFS275]
MDVTAADVAMKEESLEPSVHGADSGTTLTPESNAKATLLQQTPQCEIPPFAQWFDMKTIHDIEKKSLPEFFDGKNKSKTPVVYKDYRDFMICAYRMQPDVYLTFTACRRNLAGDVCVILRVHRFLEQWGLINYSVRPETRPSKIAPPYTGHFQVYADTPRGLAPLVPPLAPSIPKSQSKPIQSVTANRKNIYNPETSNIISGTHSSTHATNSPALQQTKNGLNGPHNSLDLSCISCAKAVQNTTHYESNTPDRFQLCATCFEEQKFPNGLGLHNFVKIPSDNEQQEHKWTSQELLLLSEGIELYPNDWKKVSEHVGTKNADECILKFLQIPPSDAELHKAKDYEYRASIGFIQKENPIVSLVSFLAKLADPCSLAKDLNIDLHNISEQLRTESAKFPKEENGQEVKHELEGSTQDSSMEIDSEQANNEETSSKVKTEATDETTVESEREQAQPEKPSISVQNVPPEKGDLMQEDKKTEVNKDEERNSPNDAGTKKEGEKKTLSSEDEKSIIELNRKLVQKQIEKLTLRLSHFEKLEQHLRLESQELEKMRQDVYYEKLYMRRELLNSRRRLEQNIHNSDGVLPA